MSTIYDGLTPARIEDRLRDAAIARLRGIAWRDASHEGTAAAWEAWTLWLEIHAAWGGRVDRILCDYIGGQLGGRIAPDALAAWVMGAAAMHQHPHHIADTWCQVGGRVDCSCGTDILVASLYGQRIRVRHDLVSSDWCHVRTKWHPLPETRVRLMHALVRLATKADLNEQPAAKALANLLADYAR